MSLSNLPTTTINDFDMTLAMCIAENRISTTLMKPWTVEELCSLFDLTTDALADIQTTPEFAKAVVSCLAELKRSGGAIEVKAEKLYEYYMETYIPVLMSDPDASHEAKLKAMERLAKSSKKIGGLSAIEQLPSSAPQRPSLNIILTTQAPVGLSAVNLSEIPVVSPSATTIDMSDIGD